MSIETQTTTQPGDKFRKGWHPSLSTSILIGLLSGIATGSREGIIRGTLNQAAPLAVPFLESGGGLPYEGLINQRAPWQAVKGGQAAGRGLLDDLLFPYVGERDDRVQ